MSEKIDTNKKMIYFNVNNLKDFESTINEAIAKAEELQKILHKLDGYTIEFSLSTEKDNSI